MAPLTLTTLRNLVNNSIYYIFVYFILMATVYFIYFAIAETVFNLWYMPHVYKVMLPCVLWAIRAAYWWCESAGMFG
jgi:hypothetical protein